MGALAELMVAYAQPLLDTTDGSPEQMNKAFAISGVCYNIGTLPESHREETIKSLQSTMGMSDTEFEAFCNSIIYPMLGRYDEMFRKMSDGKMRSFELGVSSSHANSIPSAEERATKRTAPLPYAACPCNSGRKYKFCCKQSKSLAGVR